MVEVVHVVFDARNRAWSVAVSYADVFPASVAPAVVYPVPVTSFVALLQNVWVSISTVYVFVCKLTLIWSVAQFTDPFAVPSDRFFAGTPYCPAVTTATMLVSPIDATSYGFSCSWNCR